MNKIHVLIPLLLAPLYAHAHTFLVKPEPLSNQHIPVSVLMTEKLFDGERQLRVEDITLRLMTGNTEQTVTLQADEQAKVLRGTLTALDGSAVLSARAAPRYRAIKKGQQTDDPAQTLRIEAFAKALINPEKDQEGFTQRSGDRLELVPLDNPAHLDAGDELCVLVLFDGKPLAGKVAAMSPQQTRLMAQTDAQGIARLTLPAAGSWLLRSSHHSNETDARSARYEAAASLLLQVD